MATSAIQPIHFHFKPGKGEKLVDHTPDGRPIYERTIDKGKSVPLLDSEGKEIWVKHPTTAEPLYPRRKVIPNPTTERFVPVDGGNGNITREPWTPESEAEVRLREEVRRAKEFQDELSLDAVRQGVSVSEIIAVAKALREARNTPDSDEPESDGEYPRSVGSGGWYLLSNGEKIRGREAAEAAEAALHVEPGF